MKGCFIGFRRISRRCSVILGLGIVLMALLLFEGCSGWLKDGGAEGGKPDIEISESRGREEETPHIKDAEDNEDIPVSGENSEDTHIVKNLKLQDSGYESINIFLKNRNDVSDIKWSNSNDQAAFALYDELAYSDDAVMYIWRVGKTEPDMVNTSRDRFCGFFWSPDDKYILADTGTSVCRIGHIISVRGRKRVGAVEYVFSAVWSPDSKNIAAGRQNKVKTVVDTELTGSVDTVVYSVGNKNEKVVAKGEEDFYCVPDKWENNRSLTYIKKYFNNQDEEKYTYLLDKNTSIPVEEANKDLSMPSRLSDIYGKYSENKSDELLKNLEPLDVCKMYFHAVEMEDYETMYALYCREGGALIPTLSKFLSDIRKDTVGLESSKLLLKMLREDLKSIDVTKINDKEAVIGFHFESPQEKSRSFTVLKTTGEIWKVKWLPMQ